MAFLTGAGVGAGLMYLLDPDAGTRRRARLRDRTIHTRGQAQRFLRAAWVDARNRAEGLLAEQEASEGEEEPDDRVLEERVRAKLGRYVSHPGAIEVAAHNGRVVLTGDILADELADLLTAVREVRGVSAFEDRLQVHDHPGDISSLQGGRRPPGEPSELAQRNWTPALRLLAGAAGSTFLLNALFRPSLRSSILGTIGLGLLARSTANRGFRELVPRSGRALHIDKSIDIDAPPEIVFRAWSNFENFPKFMAHVHEVRDIGDGRSRWVVEGPAGTTLTWDALVTRWQPPRAMGWASVDSSIKNAGIIHFEPLEHGGTRVRLRLTFEPPVGLMGHFAGILTKPGRQHDIDEDLRRFKSLIEDGSTSAPGKHATFESVAPEVTAPA